jgi:hypothetical protein
MGFGVVLTRRQFPASYKPSINTVVLATGNGDYANSMGNQRLEQIVHNYFSVYASGGEFEKDAIIQTVILVINDLCPFDVGFVTFDGTAYWEADEALFWKIIDRMFREKMRISSKAPPVSYPRIPTEASTGRTAQVIDLVNAPRQKRYDVTIGNGMNGAQPHGKKNVEQSKSSPSKLPRKEKKPPPSSFPTPEQLNAMEDSPIVMNRSRIRAILPPGFSPTEDTVLISKGETAKNSPGNIKLRAMIRGELKEYGREGISRGERARLIRNIMKRVYRNCSEGAFVKLDEDTDRYWEVDERIVREKISQAFRNMLADEYKSSSKSKSTSRKHKKTHKEGETGSPSLGSPSLEARMTENGAALGNGGSGRSVPAQSDFASGTNNVAGLHHRAPFSGLPSAGNPLFGNISASGSALSAIGNSNLQRGGHSFNIHPSSNYLTPGGAGSLSYLSQLGLNREEVMRRAQNQNLALMELQRAFTGRGGGGLSGNMLAGSGGLSGSSQHDMLAGSQGAQNRAMLGQSGNSTNNRTTIPHPSPATDMTAGGADFYGTYSASMVDKIQKMRVRLVDALKMVGSTQDWSHISRQKGIFAFTGMPPEMCEQLAREHYIYPTPNGEISLAALDDDNLERVVQGIHSVTKGKKLENYLG